MVTSFCIDGGGGGGGGGGNRSSNLTRSPESDPNACGRVRGIALLCVQMKNHHTSRQEQIAMQLNQVVNQYRFCGAKLLCNFKKEIIPWFLPNGVNKCFKNCKLKNFLLTVRILWSKITDSAVPS